jgi:hypothetical protein
MSDSKRVAAALATGLTAQGGFQPASFAATPIGAPATRPLSAVNVSLSEADVRDFK